MGLLAVHGAPCRIRQMMWRSLPRAGGPCRWLLHDYPATASTPSASAAEKTSATEQRELLRDPIDQGVEPEVGLQVGQVERVAGQE